MTSKKQKYLQQNGYTNDYKGDPEYSSHIAEAVKDKQRQAQQQIKSGRIGIFGNYLA